MATQNRVPSSKPASADELLIMIGAHFDGLSRQLKLIARHIEANRKQIGLDGIQELAAQCGVQPSAVVRFAKHFGLSGFSEMQALFRAEAAHELLSRSDYRDRIRSLVAPGAAPLEGGRIAQEVVYASLQSLQALEAGLDGATFDTAVDLMIEAETLWLIAARRSFPIGAYLAYALQQTAKPIHWLHGMGYMQQAQIQAMSERDVLIAISFDPYARETLEIVEAARMRGTRLLAITDSKFSPLVKHASVSLLANDSAPYGFRSLTSTMCLAQSLFINLAYRLELGPLQSAPAE